jgi:(p)ppGpp synthase/HD superfamily hydrolase
VTEGTLRVEEAIAYAAQAHRGQMRKASEVPYLAHLLAVASLVWEHGGTDDQVIAALLHDVVEDQGGRPRLDDVRARFGDRVAAIVEACSDSLADTTAAERKRPWKERKVEYLAHLASSDVPAEALAVVAADKLHNARSVLLDRRRLGDTVWDRFNAGVDDQLWYYRSVTGILRDRIPGPLTDELAETVARLASPSPGELTGT